MLNFTSSMAIETESAESRNQRRQIKLTKMKKILLTALVLYTTFTHAQTNTIGTSSLTDGGFILCPDGTYPTATVTLNTFNLHKPRTNCTSGFGMCIKFSVSVYCGSTTGKSYIKSDKTTATAKVNSQTAELHLPVALKYEKGFEKTDFTKFEVEDKTLSFKASTGVEKFVKSGIYPVSVVGDEYIIVLNLY